MLKIIFFGTPDFVVPILTSLHKTYNWANHKELVGVVTQPPKEVGREKIFTYTPVDKYAFDHKLPIYHNLEDIPPADLGIVAAYGRIIPEEVITNFKFGLLNIHPSLLPKYRGASPIQSAIKNGDTQTGLSVIKMDEQMDHGPIVSQFTEEIKTEDTNDTLRNRMFDRSAQFILDLIPNYVTGKIKLEEQNHDKATFTKLIKKKDGFINPQDLQKAFSNPEEALTIHNLIRAYTPWPGVWTYVQIRSQSIQLKIMKSHLEENVLVLDEVQLEGKNPVTFKQFQEGYPDYKLE